MNPTRVHRVPSGGLRAALRRAGAAGLVSALLAGGAAAADPPTDCSGDCEPVRFLLAGDSAVDVELVPASGCDDSGRRPPIASFRLSPESPDVSVPLPRGRAGGLRALVTPGKGTECAVVAPDAPVAGAPPSFRFLRGKPAGSVAGVVVDLGEKLQPGIEVELRPLALPPCAEARSCGGARMPTPVPRVDRTDDGGRFRFDDLTAGDYLLSLPGREPPERAKLFVAPGANLQAGEIPIHLLGTIQGTAEPEGGAVDEVVAWPADPASSSPEPVAVSEGRFRIDSLAPGRWLLFGRREGKVVVGKRCVVEPARVALVELDEPVEIVSGSLSSAGQPAEGTVCIADRFGASTRCVSTEGAGPWAIPVLASDRVRTAFATLHEPAGRVAARSVPLTATGEEAAWTFDVPPGELVLRLSLSDGAPVERGRVTLSRDGVRAGGNGRVLPGGYVSFPGPFAPGRWAAEWEDGSARRGVPLPARIEQGGYVEATLDLSGGTPVRLLGADGLPLPGATLAVRDGAGEWRFLPASPEGIARVPGSFETSSGFFVLGSGRGVATGNRVTLPLDAGIVSVVADERPSHELALEFRAAGGGPIAGARIDLSSALLPEPVLREHLKIQGARDLTGPDGRVLFPRIPEGEWSVSATFLPGQPQEIRYAPSTIELARPATLAFDLDVTPAAR